MNPQVDSLDIVELVMAMELAPDRELTDAESQELADRLRRDPNFLDGLDDEGLLGILVRKPDPQGPRPRSGGTAARPEGQ